MNSFTIASILERNLIKSLSEELAILKGTNIGLEKERLRFIEQIERYQKQIEELRTRKLSILEIIQESDDYNYNLRILEIIETPGGLRIIVGDKK